jgi:Holliday junction resolvase YEN1
MGCLAGLNTESNISISPYVTDPAEIYTSASIASHPVYLDEDGLLLFALLVGGDYDHGVPQCGHKIACGLARCGFGRELRQMLTAPNHANDLERTLAAWRSALKSKLTTNSSGFLDKCHPKLVGNIGGDFPNLDIVKLYTNPLTSWSSDFTGTAPDPSLWIPYEPCVHEVATFCVTHFGWQGVILDRLKSNFWPGVALRMMYSVCVSTRRFHHTNAPSRNM